MTTISVRRAFRFAAALSAGALLAGSVFAAGLAETEVKPLGPLPGRGAGAVLSADGTHVAYPFKKGEKWVVVFDGKESAEYDQVRGLAMSPDGKHLAFAAMRNGTWFIVLDGKETEPFAQVSAPAFSADGKHFGFCAALSGDHTMAVVDGQMRTKYIALTQEPPAFSLDGRRVAYEARTSGASRRATVRDPNRAPVPNEPPPTWVTGDGKEVDVAGDSVPRTNFMVVDERKCERTNDVRTPAFSPDGRSLAYAALFGKLWFIVLDDRKVSRFYEDVTAPVFSPDGRALAFAGRNEKKWSVVGPHKLECDGVQGLRFSPDGSHFAFAAAEGKTWSIVCDGKKGPPFDEIGWIGFSMDSAHLAYAARTGGAWVMICDGVAGPPHAAVCAPSGAAREALDKLRYVVVDGNDARLVETAWCLTSDWSAGLK